MLAVAERPIAQPVAVLDYWFDQAAADAAVRFFPEHLRFTKDRWAGKPFVLEPWEADLIIRPLFGWKRRDGTRRYRRCIVFVPRKNGKTELAAGVGMLCLVGDGIYGPEVYAIAKDEAQAAIVFDKAAAMVRMSPLLARDLQVLKKSIWCAPLGGVFRPLTGNAEGKHGLNASAIIGDELHEWPDARLYTTVHQSEAARAEPIEFLISTAGVRGRGYGWEVWEEAHRILDGTQDDPETLVVIFAAGDADDWTDERTWAKANPNLGVSVSLDYLRAECRKAQQSPRLENDFKRYHLNLWTGQTTRWLPMDAWDAGRRRDWRDETGFAGRRCVAGADLSSVSDITAIAYLFAPDEHHPSFDVAWRYFVPAERIAARVERDRVPYDLWVREGAMLTTPGNVTDYEFVIAQLLADAQAFDIAMIGVDRWNASHFVTRLADQGFPAERAVYVGQGYASLSEPSKTLERLILSRQLDHGGHPVTRWMAENVAVTTDPAGNIKPAKNKSSEKIDGISALLDALFVQLNTVPEAASVYLTRGLAEIDL